MKIALQHAKLCLAGILFALSLTAQANPDSLKDLKNYQVNTQQMHSAGLPSKKHFTALKELGVEHVVDLLPGDRADERALTQSLDLNYYHVGVIWDNPTLKNFQDYVAIMQTTRADGGKTLTHCKLNWRGAVFTYLYRVTQLKEPEAVAKKDMLAIWQPNDTWQAFIDGVKAHYQTA